MTDSHHDHQVDALAYALGVSARRQGKSYAMNTSPDGLLLDALSTLEDPAPAVPGLHEWFIERRGLVYRCAMLRATGQRKATSGSPSAAPHGWETFERWKIGVLVPKQHPLAMRYSMARVEGAQKRKQRVEAKLQSFRSYTSITVTPSVGTPGALLVFIGSESDKLQATLVVADFVDKLAECM